MNIQLRDVTLFSILETTKWGICGCNPLRMSSLEIDWISIYFFDETYKEFAKIKGKPQYIMRNPADKHDYLTYEIPMTLKKLSNIEHIEVGYLYTYDVKKTF